MRGGAVGVFGATRNGYNKGSLRDTGVFFFFQAEDGIRDLTVTGVQTCALPIYIDPHVAAGMTDSVLAAVDRAKVVVVAVYVNANSQGQVIVTDGKAHRTVALAEAGSRLMNGILARAGERTAVVAMGSPYLASAFPEVQNYLCTYSVASVSEIAAAKALFGEIGIHGRSPVTIPGIADRGAGLDRPIITSHQR